MAITRLAIKSYRSIVKADLRLGDITVIVGPSDSGKSNVIRAIRDWATNPGGYAFGTSGHSITRVSLVFDGRRCVRWEKAYQGRVGKKGKGQSLFYLYDRESDKVTVFEKIGLSVPDEVIDVTGMRPINVGDHNELIQVAGQASPWFLISSPPWSPSAVSKLIGRLSGIDSLVVAEKLIYSRKLNSTREVKQSTKRVAELEKSISDLDWIDGVDEKLKQAEAVEVKLTSNRSRLKRARQSLLSIKSKKSLIEPIGQLAKRASVFEAIASEVSELVSKVEAAQSMLGRITALKSSLRVVEDKTEKLNDKVSQLKSQMASSVEEAYDECPLCGGYHEECIENLKALLESQ